MTIVAATEFTRNFRAYNLQAQTEPVKVTNHGKIDGAYISARDLEILEAAKKSQPRHWTPGTLPQDLFDQIMQARVPDEHANMVDDSDIDYNQVKVIHGTGPMSKD